MLYNKLENTYYLDLNDAILLLGKETFESMLKSGKIINADLKAPKPKPKKIKNRKIMCIETGCVYKSATQAAKVLGYSQSNISNCCLGKLKHYKGYHWHFV
mgnify:CR=1 FL=1